ncbi:MAG: hypothetical protein WD100_08900, partial [Tistlia sp.]
MTPIRLHLEAVDFRGPGIDGWEALGRAFQGDGRLPDDDDGPVQPACLPPRAARRVSPQIRLALAVAERIAPVLPRDAGWVFASAAGESETLKVILEALREPEMMIQPLRFQNAVTTPPRDNGASPPARPGRSPVSPPMTKPSAPACSRRPCRWRSSDARSGWCSTTCRCPSRWTRSAP